MPGLSRPAPGPSPLLPLGVSRLGGQLCGPALARCPRMLKTSAHEAPKIEVRQWRVPENASSLHTFNPSPGLLDSAHPIVRILEGDRKSPGHSPPDAASGGVPAPTRAAGGGSQPWLRVKALSELSENAQCCPLNSGFVLRHS